MNAGPPRPEPVEIGVKAVSACTLPTGELPGRIDEWQRALSAVESRDPLDRGVHLRLAADADIAEIARLIVAEQGCCAFFEFALTVDQRGVGLDVRAPADQQAIVAGLFGQAVTG